ncbi:MAG: Ppx/GppA family phosphatase [Acidobacteria bacterium]|nr:Ppx/GppA family phosphatase [Acidobacteriota bacterium]
MPVFAAVDVGSNSVRLKIARLVRNRLEVLHEDREVTRLGEAVFRSGALSPKAMEHTIRVLRRFHRTAQAMGVNRVRVAATSAARDARNASVFREWVRSATGWELEVISGLEEGRLIHLGVLSGTKVRSRSLLLIDLGGGSCELTRSEDGHIINMVSLPLGAVRLTQEFLPHDPPKAKELARLREFIAEEIRRVEHRLDGRANETTIVTSGTAAALAAVYQSRNPRARTLPAAAVARVAAKLARMPLRRRQAMQGIGVRRAEIIVAGATVFASLATLLRVPSLRYSPLGLRDGILAQMAADYAHNQGFREHITRQREDSIVALCRRYGVDIRHATRVRQLVESLFHALRRVHGLAPEYREWLSAAAMLHEVGAYVNRAGRFRHGYYIISHSEIFGYTPEQRHIIAALARYMGGTLPAPEDRAVRLAPAAERPCIPRAVALLRLASALDQSRRGNITGVSARISAAAVHLRVLTRRSAELEMWALAKESAFFKTAMGVAIEVMPG